MPRVCTICSHPDRRLIDGRLAVKEPYLRISKDYGISDVTVRSHYIKHVEPFLQSVERQADAAIIAAVANYRAEVFMSLDQKSLAVESKLWDQFDVVTATTEIALMSREMRGERQEQAKLSGSYVQDAKNPADDQQLAEQYVAELKAQLGWGDDQATDYAKVRYPTAVFVSEAVN